MRRDGQALLTAEEMQRVDSVAQEHFFMPGAVLMENAGQKAWAVVAAKLSEDGRGGTTSLVFIAGNGNNGGDALVMARQCLVEGIHHPFVITLTDQLRGTAREQWERLAVLGVSRSVWETEPAECRRLLATADCLVDGVTGTGLTSPLRSPAAELVTAINEAPGRRFAVDVPSGMRDGGGGDEPHVVADLTISTGPAKRLLYAPARRRAAGTIVTVDPGFPPLTMIPELSISARSVPVDMAALQRYRPLFPSDAHKGTRGRVLIVAGAPGTEGAALLAAEAASTAGAGMVRVRTTAAGAAAGVVREPGVMWRTGSPSDDDFAWADAVVCGPGWTEATVQDLTELLRAAGTRGLPVVLDAAALRLLPAVSGPADYGASLVLTPHPGELSVLAGVTVPEVLNRPFSVLESVAAPYAVSAPSAAAAAAVPLVLLKAATTICRAASGRVSVVDGRCPALGVAGSGDVLAGIIGARLAMTASFEDSEPGEDQREGRVIGAIMEHLLRGRQLARYGTCTAGELARWSPRWENDAR